MMKGIQFIFGKKGVLAGIIHAEGKLDNRQTFEKFLLGKACPKILVSLIMVHLLSPNLASGNWKEHTWFGQKPNSAFRKQVLTMSNLLLQLWSLRDSINMGDFLGIIKQLRTGICSLLQMLSCYDCRQFLFLSNVLLHANIALQN